MFSFKKIGFIEGFKWNKEFFSFMSNRFVIVPFMIFVLLGVIESAFVDTNSGYGVQQDFSFETSLFFAFISFISFMLYLGFLPYIYKKINGIKSNFFLEGIKTFFNLNVLILVFLSFLVFGVFLYFGILFVDDYLLSLTNLFEKLNEKSGGSLTFEGFLQTEDFYFLYSTFEVYRFYLFMLFIFIGILISLSMFLFSYPFVVLNKLGLFASLKNGFKFLFYSQRPVFLSSLLLVAVLILGQGINPYIYSFISGLVTVYLVFLIYKSYSEIVIFNK